jgi:hypothetical protein
VCARARAEGGDVCGASLYHAEVVQSRCKRRAVLEAVVGVLGLLLQARGLASHSLGSGVVMAAEVG